jgi:hypothetical protein
VLHANGVGKVCKMLPRPNDVQFNSGERNDMRIGKLAVLVALSSGVTMGATCAMAQAGGGNGNGGSGGGNAHGAATSGPTMGGDNTSAATSTHKGGFHFKHKKKAKPAADTAQ